MTDSIDLLSSAGFMPHGMCYLWRPDVLALHVTSDALITLAYFSIPFTLLYFVRRRRDLEFNWMFVCFAVFIIACGTTHLLEIWTVWQPVYWLSGSVKAVTALASVPTAILLVRLVPQALSLPSPSALRLANEQLAREICERSRAEEAVRRANVELEARVAERTESLAAANRALTQEIAQREQAEQRLRSNQLVIQALLDNSPAVIYVKDLDFKYVLINRRFEEIFDRPAEGILGHDDFDLFAKGTAQAFRAVDERVLSAGRPLTEEEIAPHTDGPHTYISVKAPLRDEQGGISGMCGISMDITDRKRAERRLREHIARLGLLDRTTRAIAERQDLRSIFQVVIRSLEDHLPVEFGCIALVERANQSLVISSVGAKSVPLALELAMTEQAHLDIDGNGLGRCMRGELVYEFDFASSASPFLARLARAGLGSVVLAPLIVEGKVFAALIVARRELASFPSTDCEFLRQLSEHLALAARHVQLYSALQQAYEDLRHTQQTVMQQERLRALGQMAGGIAHDINNALSPAALYAQSLLEQESGLSSHAREHLTIIQRAIDDAGRTVERMRMFYRPRELETTLAPVNLNVTLQQVAELTRARWRDMPQERGIVIALDTRLSPNLRPIMGAENEIRDALTNLVMNAVDAMPDGGTLTLRSSVTPAVDGRSQRVSVEVADTGVGMSEDVRSRCLEPFFTTKGERGTGLGLAMVYGMIERHGAELEIESSPGRGTTIRMSFPAWTAAPIDQPRTDGRPSRQLRVLLVDDDPLLLKSLCDVLESDGHAVVTADGGQRGIEEFLNAHAGGGAFDVVISDLGMPKVDGRVVAATIRTADPDAPIILLTGWGQRLQGEHELAQCVSKVLSKPPRIAELRAALEELTHRGGRE